MPVERNASTLTMFHRQLRRTLEKGFWSCRQRVSSLPNMTWLLDLKVPK